MAASQLTALGDVPVGGRFRVPSNGATPDRSSRRLRCGQTYLVVDKTFDHGVVLKSGIETIFLSQRVVNRLQVLLECKNPMGKLLRQT